MPKINSDITSMKVMRRRDFVLLSKRNQKERDEFTDAEEVIFLLIKS